MRTIKTTLIFLILTVLIIHPAISGALDEGIQAFDARNYKLALKRFKPLAKKGNSKAQLLLGYMYSKGLKVSQSDKKALKWYKKSADLGYNKGQYYLALAYSSGKGVDKSEEMAAQWYLLAADNGHRRSQEITGFNFEYGDEVNQSYEKAAHYYELAATQGSTTGAKSLAELYAIGNGVPKNLKKAVEFYQKSILSETMSDPRKKKEERLKELQHYLVEIEFPGGGLWLQAKDTFAEEVHNIRVNNIPFELENITHAKSFELYTQSANLGYAKSQAWIGKAYRNGLSGASEKSFELALYWFGKAIVQGDSLAQYQLAMMYRFGEGVTKSEEKELKWLGKAYENGIDYAKESYNKLLLKMGSRAYNVGNYSLAQVHFEKAAKQYNYKAMMKLAEMYEKGQGVEKSYSKAIELYENTGYKIANAKSKASSLKAMMANQNQINRMDEIKQPSFESQSIAIKLSIAKSEIYFRNFKAATYIYERMAQKGNAVAQYELGVMYKSGFGGEKNYNKAIHWMKKSAEQGNPDGEFMLAKYYSQGLGSLTKSKNMALFWYKKAASDGHNAAKAIVGKNQVSQSHQGTYSWKDQQRALTQRINGKNACKQLTKNYRDGDRVDLNVGYYVGTADNRKFISCY